MLRLSHRRGRAITRRSHDGRSARRHAAPTVMTRCRSAGRTRQRSSSSRLRRSSSSSICGDAGIKWPGYIASISGSRLGKRRSCCPKTARMERCRLFFLGIDDGPHAVLNTIRRFCMCGGMRLRAITSASAACSSATWPRPDQDRAGPRQLNIGRVPTRRLQKIGLARIAAFGVGYRHGCF